MVVTIHGFCFGFWRRPIRKIHGFISGLRQHISPMQWRWHTVHALPARTIHDFILAPPDRWADWIITWINNTWFHTTAALFFDAIYFQQKTKQQHPFTLWICLQNSPSQISMTWHIQDHDDITIMRFCFYESGEDQTTSPLQIIRGPVTAHAAGIAQRTSLPSLSVTQQL